MMTEPTQYDVENFDPLDQNPEQYSAKKAMDNDTSPGVKISLDDDLTLKVTAQRNYFQQYIFNHYLEIIMNLRQYSNLPKSIDKNKLEWYLRNNYDVIIGKNTLDFPCIMGVSRNQNTSSNPSTPYVYFGLTKASIQWVVKPSLRPAEFDLYDEITTDDNGLTGSFVVLRNKPVSYTSDFEIIDTYSRRLAEIQASRYSLILQAKFSKILQGEATNNTLNEIINKIYNGAPFIKTTTAFSPKDDILDMSNPHIADNMSALKREYNDNLSELNNLLGINSSGIEKSSGVSEEEVNSNNDVVTSVGNMYINGIQQPLDLFNKRYGYNIQVSLNQKSEKVGIGLENNNAAN